MNHPLIYKPLHTYIHTHTHTHTHTQLQLLSIILHSLWQHKHLIKLLKF